MNDDLNRLILMSILVGISIISSYFPPGKSKNTAFAVLGAGQPIGYIIGMILGAWICRSLEACADLVDA